MSSVPPKFQEPKSLLGFSSRDVSILLVGALLFLAAFVAPFDFTFRVVLAVGVVVLSLVVIFFRTTSGYTLEESLWFWWAYVSRTHYHQRGADESDSSLAGVGGGIQLVPRRISTIDYFWFVWRRIVKSSAVVNAVDRARAFYALAHGEPAPTYYRGVWVRELSAFVFIAGKNNVFNYLDLKPMYPSVNFWTIVDVMVKNDLLKWESDTVLVCKDIRRMRAVVRHGMMDIPETDNGLLPYDSQI